MGTRPWGAAAVWMAVLGPLFLVVYAGTNWVAALRPDVGSFYFAWERRIPFVPWLVVPYMSLDLFFVGSVFLCGTRAELDRLGKRLAFAIAVSGLCSLQWPLRFGFARPDVRGVPGALITLLGALDRPHNLVPSLHISLLAILWGTYHRHTRGVARAAVHGWLGLVAASTVLTYQHHVADVVGGVMVALLARHLVPESRPASARLGTRYAGLAAICFLLVPLGWPWSLAALWPATAVGIVAAGYFGAGPSVFRKSGGRLPWSTRVLLGPYLIGAYLSLLQYRRRSPAWGEVVPGLLVGRKLSEPESAAAVRAGVRAVLDLTAEYPESPSFRRLAYANLPILDLTPPSLEQLEEAVAFIRAYRPAGPVYVHCALGYARSAGVVAAYLLGEDLAATPEEALRRVRDARPGIVVTSELIERLREFVARHPGPGVVVPAWGQQTPESRP